MRSFTSPLCLHLSHFQVDMHVQESVARKRRSCSGSRNGTPAVRDRRSASVDPEAAAMLAQEDSALEASLAAAEAAAVHATKQVAHLTTPCP